MKAIEQTRQKFLAIKSKTIDEHFMPRRLTLQEEAELEALRKQIIEAPVLTENEFKLFEKVVTECGGKIVPLPKPKETKKEDKKQKRLTKVKLLKELVFRYSASADLIYHKGATGHIVHEWDDVPWMQDDEIDEAKEACEGTNLIPIYISGKIICLNQSNFSIIEDNYACA